MLRSLKISLIFLFISSIGQAQFYKNAGIKLGLVYEIGQPLHRIGGTLGFHINYGHIQLNSGCTYFYAFRNYGPKISRWELQSQTQLGIAFGRPFNAFENIAMLSPISNFSNKENVFAYGIKYYLDNIETNQLTGIISFRHNEYFLAAENDGFAFLHWDQYRTGAFTLGRYITHSNEFTDMQQHRFSIDVLLYTGKTQGPPTKKMTDSNYPSRFGYKKLNNSKYSKSSHGILKLTWQSSLLFGQNTFASIGVDNEKIRNVIQNKFIHDLPFLPKRLIKIKNPHVPMRDSVGGDYLYLGNQKIRKGKFVWGVGLNGGLFY